jgi:DtxR family Mn-dependent transcriptional regulator
MLTPRTTDYLETIYLLSLDHDTVGVSQVAAEREVTIPTARSAIGRLKRAGYVRQERYGKIVLTDDGEARAKGVYRTHRVLYRFLHDVLGVESHEADPEACRLEHGLSEDTLSRLVRFLDGHPELAGSDDEPEAVRKRRSSRPDAFYPGAEDV